MQRKIESFFKSFWKPISVSFLVIYIAINIFKIGGDLFVINLNNFIRLPFVLGTAWLGFTLWRRIKTNDQNSLLWLGLTIGWFIWMIAELWTTIVTLANQKVVYPSMADFFWLIGYIPFYLSLAGRLRSLPKNRTLQFAAWFLLLLIWGATIIFIILPMIRYMEPSDTLGNSISIAYPIADAINLIFVVQLLLTYQKGMYGRAWQWIAGGFAVMAIADFLYAYALNNNLYYPEQKVNLLSTIGIDVPYNLSYVMFAVGLFLLKNVLDTYQPIVQDVQKLQLDPNTHLLVFTKGDDTVIDVSSNYSRVYSVDNVKGKTISEVLGLSPEDESLLLFEMKEKGILEERQFRVNTCAGQREILISGIVVLNPQKEYSGVMLLVRILMEDYSLDNLLTDYQKGMMHSLLSKTGTGEKEISEIKQLLTDYYKAHIAALGARAFAEGGSIFLDAFIAELQTVAEKQGWRVGIQPDSLDFSNISLAEARKALPLLLETAKKFVANLVGEESTNTVIQETNSKFGDLALKNISHFESAKGERTYR